MKKFLLQLISYSDEEARASLVFVTCLFLSLPIRDALNRPHLPRPKTGRPSYLHPKTDSARATTLDTLPPPPNH